MTEVAQGLSPGDKNLMDIQANDNPNCLPIWEGCNIMDRPRNDDKYSMNTLGVRWANN